MDLNAKKMKQYLSKLIEEVSELKTLIKFAKASSFKWLILMTGMVVVNLIISFVFDLGEWYALGGTVIAVIFFLRHIHWEYKVKMLEGAYGGTMECMKKLIGIGVGDQLKANLESIFAGAKKLAKEVAEAGDDPKPTKTPAKKKVVAKKK